MSELEIVFSKFVAALSFLGIFFVATFVNYLILLVAGKPPAILPTLTVYLGVILFAAQMLSFGMIGSALAKNQIVSYFISLGIIIAAMILPFFLLTIFSVFSITWLQELASYLSPIQHLGDFLEATIRLEHLVYYLSTIALNLYIASRIIAGKR